MQKRKQIRLKNYDYSQNNIYFITICAHNRVKLFGEIVGATPCHPNNPDKMIEKWLHQMENKYDNVKIDKYCIMPDHIHFIISNIGDNVRRGDPAWSPALTAPPASQIPITNKDEIVGATLCGRPCDVRGRPCGVVLITNKGDHTGSPLPQIIDWFKTMTTNEYIRGVKNGLYPPFDKHIWQRNYYEHIIRNQQEYETICQYIDANPLKSQEDCFYNANQ